MYGVLGLYTALVVYMIVNKKADAKEALAKAPAPVAPDYHSPVVVSSAIPATGTPEWEAFIADPANEAAWVASLEADVVVA